MNKPVIVLKALLNNIPVKIHNQNTVLADNDEIAIEINETECVVINWDLNDFIKACNKISDEEISLIAANIALNLEKSTNNYETIPYSNKEA